MKNGYFILPQGCTIFLWIYIALVAILFFSLTCESIQCSLFVKHSVCFIQFNSLTFVKLNFVLSGTIFSVAVVFYERPKSKLWHAEKIDLEKSFKMSTTLTCFVFVITQVFSFKVRNFFF